MAVASRRRFARNFSCQNRVFLLGTVARGHAVWWCQKHPFTKIAQRLERFAKSGLPGRSLLLRVYLTCFLHRWRATVCSGVVLAFGMDLMRAEVASSVVNTLGPLPTASVSFRMNGKC